LWFLGLALPKAARLMTDPAVTSASPLQNHAASANDSPGIPSVSQGTSQAVTVIWLKGGYSYGLVDYWVQDGLFHYRATYGGENSVPLDRIDFECTAEDNSQRGIQFKLNPDGAHATASSAASANDVRRLS
jgi:hypothetical protein